jgi:SAM-dependent methyltransferase
MQCSCCPPRTSGGIPLPALTSILMMLTFTLTLFCSATLLFLIQPMVGKKMLPLLGGTPAVWNTCMVFFQALLLAGYCYAHLLSRWFKMRTQVWIHAIVLLLPLIPLLWLRFNAEGVVQMWQPPTGESSTYWLFGWLLVVLLIVAGLPFLVVSTSAPLLQKWFSSTDHPQAKDPYFLYGASNIGSMLALLCYPTLIEPNMPIVEQSWYWFLGYVALIVLIVASGVVGLSSRPVNADVTSQAIRTAPPAPTTEADPDALDQEAPGWARRLRWVALAFVPSSIMLGVTTHVTTDITPMPMLWILPLALYLLSFILVFSRLMTLVFAAAIVVLFLGNEWIGKDVFQLQQLASELDPMVYKMLWADLGMLVGLLVLTQLVRFLPLWPLVVWASVLGFLVLFYLLANIPPVTMVIDPFETESWQNVTIALVVDPFEVRSWLNPDWFWLLVLPTSGIVFVLLLKRLPNLMHWSMILLLPLAILAVSMERICAQMFDLRVYQMLLVHLGALFVAAMVCHGELARTRPAPRYLTEFYLLMSLGGVLGGLFNALLAPIAMDRIWEYPLVIALPCLLIPRFGLKTTSLWSRRLVEVPLVGFVCLFGLFVVVVLVGALFVNWKVPRDWVENQNWSDSFKNKMYVIVNQVTTDDKELLYRERNFFGYFTVKRRYYSPQRYTQGGYFTSMLHGTTTHGVQWFEPEDKREIPLTYFHEDGPIGQIFRAVNAKAGDRPQRVAVLGVGTGTLAAYMKPGWELTLFEIDAAVIKVARDPAYFTYLPDAEARGVKLNIIMGDGRLKLNEMQDGSFDLLFMDAFNSDSVPIHLLTLEAIEMYKRKLAPGGLLVINIANRYLRFNSVMGNLARKAQLEAYLQYGIEDRRFDKYACAWVVMAREQQDFGKLLEMKDKYPGLNEEYETWIPPYTNNQPVWTDDYSNVFSIFRWDRR